ncbi:hypothetical protein D3C77_506340 [compost metagenome]
MKRQHQHADGIVAIQPGALALARAEGEEFFEDFLVGNNAGHQPQQHDEGGKGRQPAAPGMRHLQLEMEAVEEVATAGFAGLDLCTRGRVEVLFDEAATPGSLCPPADTQPRLACFGQANEPAASRGRMFLQVTLRQRQTGHRVVRPDRYLGLGPVIDLFLEVGHGPGQENRKQQPTENQSGPGVQPGHCLAEALFHQLFIQ